MNEKINKAVKACALSGCMLGGLAIQSAYAGEGIQWNGFFTGAFSQSDNEHPYGRFYGISDSGSYLTDTRLGLQGTGKVNDKISITTQLVAKNNRDNFELDANWLYANITLNPNYRVKLGRMQQPMYLFSSQLEAGYSMPWVRPPQEVYEQQFFNDYTGIEFEMKRYMAGHDVTLKLLHGVQENEITAGVLGKIFARPEPLAEFMSSDDFLGVALQLEGDFYRLKFAAVKQDLTVGFDQSDLNTFMLDAGQCQQSLPAVSAKCAQIFSSIALLSGGGSQSLDGDFWTAGFDINKFGARLIGEYAFRTVGDFEREGYYVSFMYQVDKVTPYVTYASHDTSGAVVLDPQVQESYTLGARYDWMPNAAVKFELMSVDPQEGSRGLYHVGFVPDEMESMTAATLALDLVF
ncbi:MAG: hypothetical protein JKY01_02485 [Pseudomonadales bacterium]|nr:hypothetical protein [Pseudomonadales bacterium]